jgi:hypothetical protein
LRGAWFSRGVVGSARHASASHVAVDSLHFRLGLILVNGLTLINRGATGRINDVDGVNGFVHGLKAKERLAPR